MSEIRLEKVSPEEAMLRLAERVCAAEKERDEAIHLLEKTMSRLWGLEQAIEEEDAAAISRWLVAIRQPLAKWFRDAIDRQGG